MKSVQPRIDRQVHITRTGALMTLLLLAMVSNSHASSGSRDEPLALFLTWQQDPTTTMTIDWHVEINDADDNSTPRPILHYKEVGTNDWEEAQGTEHEFPYSDRTIYRVELMELEPNTTYRFHVDQFSRRYKFRTMPRNLNEPLVFATGGDTRHRQSWMERTNRVAMDYDPQFIVWGGDLAYADGRANRLNRWEEWFDAIMNTLITDDGRVVPIVVGIGNHEVRGGYYFRDDDYEQNDEHRERIAPYFYNLFAFPRQPGYGVLDFRDYLSIVMLDSDHSNPVEGEQTEWLEDVLAERANIPHVIPVYHVPAFPSHRDPASRVESNVRQHWVPLFEQSNVRIAFENHDHTYKRTHPIRGGEIDPNGIVYIGDGAWGVGTRAGGSRNEWYIDQFASERHAIIVTLHGPHQHMLTVSEHGEVIDEYPRTPRRPTPERASQGRAED